LAVTLIVILIGTIFVVSFRSQFRKRQALTPGNRSGNSQQQKPDVKTDGSPQTSTLGDGLQGTLNAARDALDAGLLQDAAAKAQDVLNVDPANEDALRLKKLIDERLKTVDLPREKGPDLPAGIPRPVQGRQESLKAWVARATRSYEAWKRANDALDRSDASAALEALQSVPDDPAYPNKTALIGRAHDLEAADRARVARDQLAAAHSRDSAGDFLQALHMYQQLENDANPEIAADARTRIAALPGMIDAAIKAAYADVHNLALADTPEMKQRLVAACRRVLRLTEPGDPRRSEAEEILKDVGGGFSPAS
jgi:hypothetical protein